MIFHPKKKVVDRHIDSLPLIVDAASGLNLQKQTLDYLK